MQLRKTVRLLLLVLLVVALVALAVPAGAGKKGVTTIQSGELVGSDGVTLTVGYDQWGYNYQARMFRGDYCDAYRDAAWCQPYKGTRLIMKWNDAWLSNVDADGDGLLDRHFGFPTYIGSGAWLTNHMSGSYEQDGKVCTWSYFTKIVAAPADAYVDDGVWYTADGVEIGPVIWGSFATIQTVDNDPCAGLHGLSYLSGFTAGFGAYAP